MILSAGAIDSPKLLLLSGIGPREELQAKEIPVIKALLGIGKNLHDHLFVRLARAQKPEAFHRTTYLDSPEAIVEARQQWQADRTGPLSTFYYPQLIGHFKSDAILTSNEFQELDIKSQKALQAETNYCYETYSVRTFHVSHQRSDFTC